MPTLLEQRPTESLIMAPFPRVMGQLPGGRFTALDHFQHASDSVLFLLEETPWIWICLPAHNASAQTTIRGLAEYLIHSHGSPHSMASGQGTHFTAREMQHWAHAHGIH